MQQLPEYNTDRGTMFISEYGRNIQKMVEFAVNEPDREKRNKLALALITLMGNLNPHLRDVADYKHKLWDHLFIISNFKLDVDSPYTIPTAETIRSKPQMMDYPQQRIRFRFYGKNIENMIKEAADMEEGPVKAGFINLIGSFMKQSCRNWNEEQLSDEEILAHLEMLSGGRIKLTTHENDVQFNALEQQQQQQFRNNRNNNNNKNRFRNGGGGQNNNNNRNFRNGGGGGQNNNNNRNNNNGGGGGGQNRNFRNNNNKNRGN
jgi:hypothetical protein